MIGYKKIKGSRIKSQFHLREEIIVKFDNFFQNHRTNLIQQNVALTLVGYLQMKCHAIATDLNLAQDIL